MAIEKYITSSCVISGNTIFKDEVNIFVNDQVNLNNLLLSAYLHFNIDYPKFYKMDNLSKLGWLSAEILLQGLILKDHAPEEIGIILSNANASLDTDINYLETTKDMASPSLFVYTLPSIVTGEICIRNNFKGENAFFISEHFDTAFMEQYVSGLLDNNILSVCICGWIDVYEEEYKAALFLIKKEKGATVFTQNNLDMIFKTGDL